jgi:glycosyltransferase involved in cell wall biosynthesis
MSLSDLPSEIKRKDVKLIVTPYKWHSLSEQSFFLKAICESKLDLMHFTYFSYPILYRRPFVATVHDVTPLFFKTGKASIQNGKLYTIKNQLFKYVVQNQISNSKHILVPSYSVKKELMKQYSMLVSKKITVTYEGLDYSFQQMKKHNKTKNLSDFILYVGNFYPHKNIERLLLAWKQINTDKRLVLLGPKDIFSEKLKRMIAEKNINQVIWIHNSDFLERIKYYSSALALIHPSLSEGFGLPIIEGMHFNLPIIASDIPVFKELLGNSYFSFNPKNVNNIANKISTFLHAKSNLSDWLAAYQNNLKQYSFEQMAKQTYEVYKNNLK